MFAQPRPRKPILPPQGKKRRKATFKIDEIAFDNDARQEYLTGFHKRKLQRALHAQQVAARKAREERLELRKQMRDERRQQVEEHVQTVNRLLREADAAGRDEDVVLGDEEPDEWNGIEDEPAPGFEDQEQEYVDEDRYTTVTIESVAVSRDGFYKPEMPGPDPSPATAPERNAHPPARKKARNPSKKKP